MQSAQRNRPLIKVWRSTLAPAPALARRGAVWRRLAGPGPGPGPGPGDDATREATYIAGGARGADAGAQHERLDIYMRSLDAVAELVLITRRLPEPWGDLREQLRRAATSIPLNIAEGAAEFSPADKARFYRYARRSSAECMAILDVISRVVGASGELRGTKRRLDEINAMLTKLIRVHSRAVPGPGPGPGPGPA